jgi:excisionase family DNA binding protein
VTNALLTLEQAAKQLNCSPATLKRRLSTGALPCFRDGRLLRIRQTDLDQYIEQRLCLPAEPTRPARTAETTVPPPGRKLYDLPDPLT